MDLDVFSKMKDKTKNCTICTENEQKTNKNNNNNNNRHRNSNMVTI